MELDLLFSLEFMIKPAFGSYFLYNLAEVIKVKKCYNRMYRVNNLR